MSIIDTIKNSVLESFNTTVAPADILLGLGTALLAGLFILLVYRCTMRQVAFNRSYCVTLLLVSVISAMMVLTITSNLALSLGMVGALSIIRFRTAIKDASDTAFLFWAVAAGITSGAGFYLLTALGCLVVGLVCVLALLLFDRMGRPFLLVIRGANSQALAEAAKLLEQSRLRCRLSSLSENSHYSEVIYEAALPKDAAALTAKLKALQDVLNVSFIDCRKS